MVFRLWWKITRGSKGMNVSIYILVIISKWIMIISKHFLECIHSEGIKRLGIRDTNNNLMDVLHSIYGLYIYVYISSVHISCLSHLSPTALCLLFWQQSERFSVTLETCRARGTAESGASAALLTSHEQGGSYVRGTVLGDPPLPCYFCFFSGHLREVRGNVLSNLQQLRPTRDASGMGNKYNRCLSLKTFIGNGPRLPIKRI
jgi:hypothetical protein